MQHSEEQEPKPWSKIDYAVFGFLIGLFGTIGVLELFGAVQVPVLLFLD